MLSAILVLSGLALVSAGCDNSCSGHGSCNIRSICTCYDNWGIGMSHDSGDCSDRICPFEFAWVDTPDKKGKHHKYQECGAKGICNRGTGECECFPGFEGKSCGRSSCPNLCSGHGHCTNIQDMPFQQMPADAGTTDFTQQDASTFDYYNWDAGMTRGCVCDPEYSDVDCSKRMCPYGTDVMDIRNNMDVSGQYQTQTINFESFTETAGDLDGKTFALTFKSKLNETFTTIPIVMELTLAGFHGFVNDVQEALQGLPNGIIDKANVAGTYDIALATASLNVSFVGNNVQGPQHLLSVRSIECGDGCTPLLTGLELKTTTSTVQSTTSESLSDYNSYECGRRGKCDYTSGLCACHAGYTGNSCNTITALV